MDFLVYFNYISIASPVAKGNMRGIQKSCHILFTVWDNQHQTVDVSKDDGIDNDDDDDDGDDDDDASSSNDDDDDDNDVHGCPEIQILRRDRRLQDYDAIILLLIAICSTVLLSYRRKVVQLFKRKKKIF